jgi:hypothetical protein
MNLIRIGSLVVNLDCVSVVDLDEGSHHEVRIMIGGGPHYFADDEAEALRRFFAATPGPLVTRQLSRDIAMIDLTPMATEEAP